MNYEVLSGKLRAYLTDHHGYIRTRVRLIIYQVNGWYLEAEDYERQGYFI
jgi:hypothetical protein